MRLYIGPCGLGLGHVTRCEKIAREFATRGDEILFSSYLDGIDYLRRTEFRHYSACPISFRTREDGTVDPKLTATQNGVTVGLWKFVKQLVGEVKQISSFRPDVIISDTRVSTLLAGFILRKPTCLILNQYNVQMPNYQKPRRFTDRLMLLLARIVWKYASTLLRIAWGMSNATIIPDLPAPYTISTYNLPAQRRTAGKVRLVGSLNWGRGREQTKLADKNLHQRTVFACVSGPASDRKYLARELSQTMNQLSSEWKTILSCGDPNGSPLPTQNGKLSMYEWMDERTYEQTIKNADVIVSRAGHETIMKAVSFGKPLVLIPPPNHTEQSNNARRAAELGIAVVLSQRELKRDGLERAILESLEKCSERSARFSEATQSYFSTNEVVEIVYSLARQS